MTGFAVKGWCPGALRPMLSGDGLVVRIRPRQGRFSAAQVAGIARAALAHGSGVIDLTSRANLQIRGVREMAHPDLIQDLNALGLVDATETEEARRNIIVSPFADADMLAIVQAVESALPDLPPLPGKFGFVVDCGPARLLAAAAGDIRVERAVTGGLMLRADGMDGGWPVEIGQIGPKIGALVAAFLAARDPGMTRMAELVRSRPDVFGSIAPRIVQPVEISPTPGPGLHPAGALVGFAFGQTTAATFAALATLGPVRLTPWRMVLIEGLGALPGFPGLITDPADPLRRVVACTGAPGCPQGLAPTRRLARSLAPHVPPARVLHVSGCAKGCAHPGIADLTLVATPGGFAPIRHGTARDAPLAVIPNPDDTPAMIESYF